jgi:intracellular multiplication protein IcmD
MKNISTVKGHTNLKPMLSLCGYFGAIVALYLVSHLALADSGQSLGGVAGTITKSMDNVAKLITAASYVAGVGFALMGMLKFKAHKDNPTQVPLSQPIVLLAIAAGLVFLPSLISSAGSTVWESGGKSANTQGTGVEGVGGGS